MQSPLEIDEKAFPQFIFNNADFNTQTLNGFNTFHAWVNSLYRFYYFYCSRGKERTINF